VTGIEQCTQVLGAVIGAAPAKQRIDLVEEQRGALLFDRAEDGCRAGAESVHRIRAEKLQDL
jgi:hypothetical protein